MYGYTRKEFTCTGNWECFKKLEVNDDLYIGHPFFVHVQSIVRKVIGKHFTVSDAIWQYPLISVVEFRRASLLHEWTVAHAS